MKTDTPDTLTRLLEQRRALAVEAHAAFGHALERLQSPYPPIDAIGARLVIMLSSDRRMLASVITDIDAILDPGVTNRNDARKGR